MDRAFSVTMIRPSTGLPSFELGAYEYVGASLPAVGTTIPLRRVVASDDAETVQGYVTRVNPAADTPIVVTEVTIDTGTTTDDYLA